MKEFIDTFMCPSLISIVPHVHRSPFCFNGMTGLRRYRITVELIDEPKEVLRERALTLIKTTPGWDVERTVRSSAKRLGIDLGDAK